MKTLMSRRASTAEENPFPHKTERFIRKLFQRKEKLTRTVLPVTAMKV